MKRRVRISGWLLAAALAAAPLALAQQQSGPASQAKPSPLTPVAKAQEARQATEKASAKSKAAAPATEQAPAAAAAGAPAAQPPAKPGAASQRVTRSGERRDPFRTMIREKQPDQPIQVECGTLTRSILIGETELSGIVKEPGGYIAVVSVHAGERTYFLREGTPVCNGVVQNITPDSIVFLENVIDPMGHPVKREVIKKIPAEAK